MSILQRLLLTIILLITVPACAAPGAGGTATVAPAPPPTPTTGISPTEENQPEENNLANTEWRLTSFGPMGAETPALAGTAVTLTFDAAGQAGGSGGCNSYGSDYQVQGDTLIFGEVVSTLMACTDEGITEQEQRFLGALRSAGEFERMGDQLIIHYDNGQGVLNFVAADTPTPSENGNNLVGSQWQLESFGPTAAEMPVIAASTVTLEFESANQAGGSGGCNSYGGDYTVQGDSISFGQIISTERACAEQAITEQEQQYLAALLTAESFSQTADRLTILYNDRQNVLNFIPATAVDSGSSSSDLFPPENPTRIAFDPGETSAEVNATIEERDTHFYVLRAFEGQQMTVEITSPNNDVLLSVIGEDGTPLKRYQNGPPSWTSELPATQDYYIHAVSVGPATAYTLNVQIDPLASNSDFPPEDATRITFASGETSAEIGPTNIAEYDIDYYVLEALEGQEMTVEITSPNNDVLLTIVTEDGMPIKRYQNGPPASWTGTLPATQDYYIYAISFGSDTSYSMFVQIDPL